MAHIAFFNFPAVGHVNPTLGVVEELVKRGHRVTCTATEFFVPAIKAAGATPIVYESPFGEFYRSPYNDEMMAGEGLRCLDEAIALHQQVSGYYGDDRPDVVVHDFMAWGARFYASEHELPAVRLFPSYGVSETFNIAAKYPWSAPDDPRILEMIERITALLPTFGLPGDMGAFVTDVAETGVIFLPREFHYEGDTFDDRFVFAGPSIKDRSTFQGSWKPKSAERPVLLISLGTASTGWPEFFSFALQAFGDSGRDVVMALGDHIDPADLGDVPANFEIRRHVPQLDVLRHADVFLTHAGMNSTMESLYHGVPMVAVPQMNEQRANALRVEELGLGRHLPREEVTAESLRASVDAVAADAAVAERVRAMKEALRAVDGPAVAADAVERRIVANG
ncbi:macrolide family glycosyltransferase [Streptomyces sp. SM14]|uniref:macrolide family glycosyltransferase n=1 Tax=Streptomyces sp. SM14 TaxID=1736045 RepID=UPI000CD51432|nr:macrolide family glycosyltransferase [Streptomyces sp. SM14]